MVDEKISLTEFLENHLPYRTKFLIKLGVILALIFCVIYIWNLIRDQRAQLQALQAKAATLEQKKQTIGDSVVTGNQVGTQKDVDAQGKEAFGPDVLLYMKSQDAKLNALTSAVAQVEANQYNANNLKQDDLTQHQDQSGQLSGFKMNEDRGNLPPISQLSLSYNPKEKDVAKAFQGTFWVHNREDFTITTGDWKEADRGGRKTTVNLRRSVYSPNGTLIGQEQIPVSDGSTIYAPNAITPTPPSIPRFTFMLGLGKQNSAAGIIDYRISNKFGMWGGVTQQKIQGIFQSTLLGGVSLRFGNTKQWPQ